MNPHPAMEKLLNWLLNHSAQAGVLVLLVLFVQWIFRRRLASRWRFALWWIVLARLLLPAGPQSAVSLFNYFRAPVAIQGVPDHGALHPATANASQGESVRSPVQPVSPPVLAAAGTAVQNHETRDVENSSKDSPAGAKAQTPAHPLSVGVLIVPIAIGAWLGGVVLLLGCIVSQILRFQWKLRRSAADAAQPLCELLRGCQQEFGVRREIKLLETDAVKSPALFGLVRLRLLLPRGFSEKFSQTELRYIFLHELAHIKRGDLWLNWLITVLQIAHWFNPLIWFGFARLRSDRELACDELALLHAGEKTGTPYGETIIKLLEGLSRPAAIPGLVGILEDRKQMRRRIGMIANFKRPGRWSALALLLMGAIAATALTDAQSGNSTVTQKAPPNSFTAMASPDEEDAGTTPRPDLTGEVRVKGGGPVAATVFISTAEPKTGTSVFCPSCYADCSKNAKADSEGQFKIESLNPRLIFRILAVANGYKPQFVTKVDPAKGPVTIELEPVTSADAMPDHSLRGRVVDTKGAPVGGATVEMLGIETKDGGAWGAVRGVDPLAVTDENGKFLITANRSFDTMTVVVEARLFARGSFEKLRSGGVENELKMTEGSTLTGRVLLNGKPLKDITVGVSGAERGELSHFLGHLEVGTASNGVFTFVSLPPDADFNIYGLMSTMKEYGAIPIQKIHTGKDGETTQVGDLVVGPAHRLSGRVELSDGQPTEANTRLLITRENAWDSLQLTLGADGGFDTTGIPDETIALSVRVKGYHLSPLNKSLDRLNPRMIGKVDRDITGLVCLLDKGPNPRPNLGGGVFEAEADWPENRPLAGAEGGVDHSREWTISGHVFDKDTKQPITSFTVTPGQSDEFGRTGWDTLRAVQANDDGSFVLHIEKKIAEPMLKVEASGYLPASLDLQSRDQANADISLTRGTGPAGTVLSPDGTPATNASVILVCQGKNDYAMSPGGELHAYWNRDAETKTDADGHFSFKPQLGMETIATATENGYASVPVDAFKSNPQITLQAFGKVAGVLKRPAGPGTNEDLDLAFTEKDARGLPEINLTCHAVTDSEGRFTFERVPPGHLLLSYRVPMNRNSWRSPSLQEVDVQPGQTMDLQVQAAERAPNDEIASYEPPKPQRIAGEEIKGVVLSPDGQPAAGAKVVVQVDGIYLMLGRATFRGNDLRGDGLLVDSQADGTFRLPMFERTVSVVALNEDGFARVTLDDFKRFLEIRLQKWGRVEGTLEVGHHAGANERVGFQQWREPFEVRSKAGTNETAVVHNEANQRLPLDYTINDFQAKADDRGHFIINFIPPGKGTINRQVALGGGAYTYRRLGEVEIKSGETTTVHFESTGRTVVGKIAFSETNSPEMNHCQANLNSVPTELFVKMLSATPAERQALRNSPEVQAATRDAVHYPATLRPDGTFSVEDVPPGTYHLILEQVPERPFRSRQMPTNMVVFASTDDIAVPQNEDKNNDVSFDAGVVQMKSFSISGPD
jgi:beta-lactamase regulating signal transducer with metallopeptidase domain/uncharacterized GH25 family protein